ncbi:hypothetical protein [Nocardiopsis sp. LOL_012]|uniref:hypothetical protein n=1 Tax=Nocardiopsis sp. LOL_012 TaxID=3345409 RepID=UPI003A8A6915
MRYLRHDELRPVRRLASTVPPPRRPRRARRVRFYAHPAGDLAPLAQALARLLTLQGAAA